MFSTKKGLLTHAYTRKLCVNTQKSLCTQGNVNQSKQSCVYTTISRDFLCRHSVSHLLFNGRHKIYLSKCVLIFVLTHENFPEYTAIFVCRHSFLITLEWLAQREYFLCRHKTSLCRHRISLSTQGFFCVDTVSACIVKRQTQDNASSQA